MTKYEFLLLYQENFYLGIILALVSLIVVFFIMRRHVYSIFDPMFFFLIMGAFAYSVVLFLYTLNMISHFYFYSFLMTQASFFLGWHCHKPLKMDKINKINFSYGEVGKLIYYIMFSLFMTSQILVYVVKGIPVLMESRLEAFSGGGGFGVFNRILFVSSTVSLSIASFRLIYLNEKNSSRLFDFMVLFVFFTVQILSGSKSAILVMIFIPYLTIMYSYKFNMNRENENKQKRYFIKLILVSFPFAVITIFLQHQGNEDVDLAFVITGLAMRFVNTGDIFFMSWPYDFISSLSNESGFLALFKDIIGSLRLVPRDLIPTHLGLQIFWGHYTTDVMSGPNARHNVFGLFYFGFAGSILYSFILGYLTGFFRNTLYRLLPPNITGLSAYVILCYAATFIGQDFSAMAMMYFFSFLLIFPFCLIFANVVGKVMR